MRLTPFTNEELNEYSAAKIQMASVAILGAWAAIFGEKSAMVDGNNTGRTGTQTDKQVSRRLYGIAWESSQFLRAASPANRRLNATTIYRGAR